MVSGGYVFTYLRRHLVAPELVGKKAVTSLVLDASDSSDSLSEVVKMGDKTERAEHSAAMPTCKTDEIIAHVDVRGLFLCVSHHNYMDNDDLSPTP